MVLVLYSLAAFEFVTDFRILKARLESDNIPVFPWDGNTLNCDPLIGNAIGGVKLQLYCSK